MIIIVIQTSGSAICLRAHVRVHEILGIYSFHPASCRKYDHTRTHQLVPNADCLNMDRFHNGLIKGGRSLIATNSQIQIDLGFNLITIS